MNTNETNEQTEWRPLDPLERVQAGDQCNSVYNNPSDPNDDGWIECTWLIGFTPDDKSDFRFRTRRPHPTTPSAIRRGEPLWCADCKSYHPIGLHTDTPSDAPTPDVDEEWEKEQDNSRYPSQYVSADFARRLERERDEARAELAKLKTPTPPTDGSAVEWTKERFIKLLDNEGEKVSALSWKDALELARRADEAEIERDAAIRLIKELNATKYQHGRQYRSRCGQFLSTINRNKQ